MTDLLDDCPEAYQFCKSVAANLHDYRMFPDEKFATVTMGVLASDSVDSQSERFPPAALEAMVEHVEKEGLWSLCDHDPTIHPIGRLVAAKLFFAARSKTWFVAGVMGAYDSRTLPTFKEAGIDCVSLGTHTMQSDFVLSPELDDDEFAVRIGASVSELDLMPEISAAAAAFPNARLERTFRKALDPLSIVTVSVSIWVLSQTPFLKKYQERLGEKAADATLSFLEWLKTHVAIPIFRKAQRRTLLELAAEHHGCLVQFLIDSTDCADVTAALDGVERAAGNAISLLQHLKHLRPQKLVYLYDASARQWFPLHAATRELGVITDRPTLIALEKYRGFSLGGASGKDSTAQRSSVLGSTRRK
jgi:hypothetical protein